MWLLAIGLLGLALKYLEFGPLAELSWWWTLLPFALAVCWWAWADTSGYTKRREMDKMDARKQARLDKQRHALGLGPGGKPPPSRNPRKR
jgi:small Trp-rich protein